MFFFAVKLHFSSYLISDLFVCIEVDSYGHYFRKAKSKLICRSSNPAWNETYVLELEGSQNLRILLYEENQTRPILRAKHTLKVRFTCTV